MKSLPGEPQLGLDSFDSFTRLDAVLSSRHALTGGVIYFPRKITNADALDVPAGGDDAQVHAVGVLGRRRRSAHPVGARGARNDRRRRASSRSIRRPRATEPMVYAPQSAERQLLQPPGTQRPQPAAGRGADRSRRTTGPGQHVFKVGVDLQHSRFDGDNYSQELDVRRLDGSLAERTTYSPPSDASRGAAAPSSPSSPRTAGASTIG